MFACKREARYTKPMLKLRYVLPLLILTACGDSVKEEEEALALKNESVAVLYNRAYDTFGEQEYKTAIEQFEEVERQHPFSPWAQQAQIMAAYAAYRGGYFDDGIAILDRFVKLYPTHAAAPYAYYLKAMSYYTQISDVGRDQKKTEEARNALKDVVARFPDSDYARDAKLKLDLTTDHLAGKEMEIGRYYLKQRDYVAAIGRFERVIETYDTTSHTPEALHRLVECYLALGVIGEAKKYAAVLGHNYGSSEWYGYSYAMLKGNLSPEERKSTFDTFLPTL